MLPIACQGMVEVLINQTNAAAKMTSFQGTNNSDYNAKADDDGSRVMKPFPENCITTLLCTILLDP